MQDTSLPSSVFWSLLLQLFLTFNLFLKQGLRMIHRFKFYHQSYSTVVNPGVDGFPVLID